MNVSEIRERNIELFRSQADNNNFKLFPLIGKEPVKGVSWKEFCSEPYTFKDEDFKGRNAGIACGPLNNILVLDVDYPLAFDLMAETFEWDLPETYKVRTSGDSFHLYYRWPNDGHDYSNKSLTHPVTGGSIFDVRGNGGYVVAPGSIHPDTGKPYTIMDDRKIAEAPHWLKQYILSEEINRDVLWDVPPPAKVVEKFIIDLKVSETTQQNILEGKPKGQRSDAQWAVILDLLRKGVAERKIEFIFEQYPIGEKFRGKGAGRKKWLLGELERAKKALGTNGTKVPNQNTIPDTQERYPEIIQELNSEYAVVQLGGKTVIMKETVEPTFNRPDVQFMSVGDFKNWFANRLIRDPMNPRKEINIANHWLQSKGRRQYNGIVFDPTGETPGYYNLWRGFSVEPIQGDWSLMKDHIFEVIADGNQEVYDYIIYWLADLVQNPGGKRPGVSIVLRGEQGTGKGCFVTNIGEIVGNHFLHITNKGQLTGRFNQHLKDALFVFVDEGIWAGDREAEGQLKAMITEDTLMVEPKGKDPFPVKNHIRLMFASNNQWVVPTGMGDRRFMVLDVSNKHARDKSWFNPLWHQMNNGGREAMLFDLLNMDISKVDLRDFPRTEARLDQIVNTMTPIEKFWLDRLKDGEILDTQNEWTEAVPSNDVYEDFINGAKNIGERYRPSKSQFGKLLKELCPDVVKKRQTNAYGDREWVYHFPMLADCRKAFEVKVGQPINWD